MELIKDVLLKLLEESKKNSANTIGVMVRGWEKSDEVNLLEVKTDYIKVRRSNRVVYIRLEDISLVMELKTPQAPILG